MKFLIFLVAIVAAISATKTKRSAPLKVSVFYESHCPDSYTFITKHLQPIFCKVADYIDLELVPFGKAYSTADKGFVCQHGEKECRGNTIHNCVLKRIADPVLQVDYAYCAMYDANIEGHIENTCVNAVHLNVKEIEKCYTGQEGYNLMLKAERETKSKTPGPRFVPTIVFNDQYNDADQDAAWENIETALCAKFNGLGMTDICDQTYGGIINERHC